MMKKFLCALLCAMLLTCLPALAEENGVTLVDDTAPTLLYYTGDGTVSLLAWHPLDEGADLGVRFASVVLVSSENTLIRFDVLPEADAITVTEEELFQHLDSTADATKEELLGQGYLFEAEQYLLWGPVEVCSVEEVETLGWFNTEIYATPMALPASGPFSLGAYLTSTGAGNTITLTGQMSNLSTETACIEEITALIMLDGQLNVAVCPVVEFKTPPVGIPADKLTPVTITATMPAGFSPIDMLPVYTLAAGEAPVRTELGTPTSELVIGKSGDYCYRYSVPYIEGTDPADYYIVCQAIDLDWNLLACHWFMPGEGTLEDGQVVFPIVPAYLGADAMMSINNAYLVTEAE